MKYAGTATPAARNVAIPQAVACLFPFLSACANTAIDAAAARTVTIRNSPKVSRYTRRRLGD